MIQVNEQLTLQVTTPITVTEVLATIMPDSEPISIQQALDAITVIERPKTTSVRNFETILSNEGWSKARIRKATELAKMYQAAVAAPSSEIGSTEVDTTQYRAAKHALGLLVETIEERTDKLSETDPAKLREIGDTATRLNYLLSCAEEATAQQAALPIIQLVEQVEPEQVEVVVDTDSPSESGMKFAHSCLGEDFDYEGMSIHDIALEIYKRAGSPKPRLRQNGSTMTDPIERLTMRLQGMSIGQIAEHTESTKTTVDSWFYQQIMKNIKTKQEKEQAARKPPVRLRDTLQQTPLKIEKDSTQPHDIITNRLGSLGILDANELSAFHALVNPRKRTEVTNETINTTRKLKNIMQDELGPWKELLGKLTPFQQLRIRRLMGIAVTKAGRIHDATIFPLSHDVARVRAEGGDDIHIIKNSLLGINTLIRMLEEAGSVKETA